MLRHSAQILSCQFLIHTPVYHVCSETLPPGGPNVSQQCDRPSHPTSVPDLAVDIVPSVYALSPGVSACTHTFNERQETLPIQSPCMPWFTTMWQGGSRQYSTCSSSRYWAVILCFMPRCTSTYLIHSMYAWITADISLLLETTRSSNNLKQQIT